jgi:cytochrome c biogenesis protein CcdA
LAAAAAASLSLALGRLAGDLGGVAIYLVAAGCIVAGLYLLDVITLPGGWNLPTSERRGAGTAFLIGAIFGFPWVPAPLPGSPRCWARPG